MKIILSIAGLMLVGALITAWLGISFGNTPAPNANQYTGAAEAYKEGYAAFSAALTEGFFVIGRFIRDYRDEIVAVETLFIAAFTIVLAFATGFLYDATRDLVEKTDQTAERQLRAYVFVKEVFIRNLDGPEAPAIHVYVKNWGQTPAYKYTNVGAVKYVPFPNIDFSRDPKGDQRVTVTTIPPSGESAIVVDLPFIVTPPIKEELKAGKYAIYAFGRIEYDDAFKKHRVENYRFIFGGDSGTRTFERDGIRLGAMAQTTEGNSADDE
jgi:hypothetical protein